MDLAVTLLTLFLLSSALVNKAKLNAAAAPFVSLAGVVLTLIVFGVFGLLVPGILLIYAAAAFCGWWVYWRGRREIWKLLAAVLQPGFVFFLAATVYFWLLLGSKNAGFRVWDEFSFWGTAAKQLFVHDKLYTLFSSSMINISYPPGLPLTSYFLQFLSPDFSEWKCYAAYDMLAMACTAPLLSRVKWRNPLALAATAAFGAVGIYGMYYALDDIVYANAYADWIVGFVFAAPLLIWYCGDREAPRARYFGAMAAVMLLPMIKDIGLALGLVAAGILALDSFVSGESPVARRADGKRRFALELAACAALLLAVVASYFVWTVHFGLATNIERVTIPYEFSALQMLRGEDPYFNEILLRMKERLFIHQLATFGTVHEMIVVFTAIPLGVALFCREKRDKLRLALFALLAAAGFALYYLFHAYMYAAIFYHTADYDLVCYGRYIGSYAIGWYFAVAGVCLSPLAEPYALPKLPAPLARRLRLLPGVLVTAAALAATVRYTPRPFAEYCVSSAKVDVQEHGIKELVRGEAASFRSALTADTRVYVIAQDSSGGEWFICNYVFMPAYTVSTMGAGNLASQEMYDAMVEATGGNNYLVVADRESFSQYLRENEVDLLCVLSPNDYFFEEFGALFDDGLAGRYDGTTYFYAVRDTADGMRFLALRNSAHYRDLLKEWAAE